MDQSSAPLFEELLRFIKRSRGNFHVPGHKQGNAFDLESLPWFHSLLQLDLTEVGGLDDLHQAEGVIADAQRLAADAFGADQTFFMVGGTTVGNLATILTLCRKEEEVIVQRSCHQSVFNGCYLAGAKVITLPIELDPESHMEMPLCVKALEETLIKYPRAKGVVVTSPSYYGVVQPLNELADMCHAYNVPLVVDEAHGAHLGFHPELPLSAMQCNADLSIQSTHKMLTSMTMSSMLHIQGDRIAHSELCRWLRMLQSSSPSYPLMASLDVARRYMVECGTQCMTKVLSMLTFFRQKLRNLPHLQEVQVPLHSKQDPFKLTIQSFKYPVSGYWVQKWLEGEGCYVELADQRNVLFSFSLGTTSAQLEKLYGWLSKLDKIVPDLVQEEMIRDFPSLEYGQPVYSLEKVRSGKGIEIPLKEAVGHIVAEMVVPYPPGIPFLLPGEVITNDKIRVLQQLIKLGAMVRGITSTSSPSICVVQ